MIFCKTIVFIPGIPIIYIISYIQLDYFIVNCAYHPHLPMASNITCVMILFCRCKYINGKAISIAAVALATDEI